MQPFLHHLDMEGEIIFVFQLPSGSIRTKRFDDYGFTSPTGNHFLYASSIVVYTFEEIHSVEDYAAACMQMEEFLVAQFIWEQKVHFVVDSYEEELMIRIAQAYQCKIQLTTFNHEK